MNIKKIISSDALRYRKDCMDFVKLDDGTIVGDYKYCNLSRCCRQVDVVEGRVVPMRSDYLPVADPVTGIVNEWADYCTGLHDKRSKLERFTSDERVS